MLAPLDVQFVHNDHVNIACLSHGSALASKGLINSEEHSWLECVVNGMRGPALPQTSSIYGSIGNDQASKPAGPCSTCNKNA